MTFEALDNLMGCYVYEDVFDDFGSVDGTIEAFANLEHRYALDLRGDIEAILIEHADEDELRLALKHMGLGILPLVAGWPSYRAWLLAVADRVDAVLQNQQRPA